MMKNWLQHAMAAADHRATALAGLVRRTGAALVGTARRAAERLNDELRARQIRGRVRDDRMPWMPGVRWAAAHLVAFSATAAVLAAFSPAVLTAAGAFPLAVWLVWTAPADRLI